MASRYAKLCNVSLTGVFFEKGKIKYKVLPSWYYDVKVSDDDPYKLEMVSYKKYFGDKLYRVVWTEKEHYRTEELNIFNLKVDGDKQPIGETTSNPYGVIPYAVLRLKEQGDFWGNGMTDLVNGNEQINIIMTELMNEHILMGGAGTLMATNCNLATQQQNGTWTKPHVQVGRKHPIVVENADSGQNGKMPPTLEYVSTDPQMLELRDTIDWHIKMFAMSKGLNPNSFLAEVQDTSGFSKVMDAFEQMELRKDDIEPSRQYEDDRYRITQIVNDTHYDTTDRYDYDLKPLGKDTFIKVDFAEVKTYLTPEQQQTQDENDLKLNKVNILDIMRRDNPDLTDDELILVLEKNKEINDKYLTKTITTSEEVEDVSEETDEEENEADNI